MSSPTSVRSDRAPMLGVAICCGVLWLLTLFGALPVLGAIYVSTHMSEFFPDGGEVRVSSNLGGWILVVGPFALCLIGGVVALIALIRGRANWPLVVVLSSIGVLAVVSQTMIWT